MKMATSLELSQLTTNIEGIYSATPRSMTEPRFSHTISVLNNQSLENDQDHHGILQKRMHIILCYKKQKTSNNDSRLQLGGTMNESLGSALVEHPILAGRLRRSENGGLEIVSNDSGIRCVEAQMPLSLDDFLASKENKSDFEDMLVYWQNIENSNPQFSPLFYIQVTKFKCGGYSLGISYSLLLTDPSTMVKFLNRWAEIHRSMACEGEIPKTTYPSYAPNFENGCSGLENGTTHVSTKSRTISKTMIYNIHIEEKLYDLEDEICKHFMLLCLDKAENKFGSKMTSAFTLITKKPDGDAKVELFSRQGNNFASPKNLKYELNYLRWEDLGINEVSFQRENDMVDATRWNSCDVIEGVVVVVISSSDEGISDIKVYITFPGDQEIC